MVDGYDIKRLPFPLSYRTKLVQDDTLDYVAGNPIADDCSWVVFQLSYENRRKLTSAMLAGLDQLYPDEFIELFQLWMQPFEYPNTFPDNVLGGCMPLDLCQLILQCIDDTPELQDAISQYALSAGASLTDEPVQEILDKPIVQGFTGCTNDNMFGAITGLVDLLNDMATDIIQILNDNQNTVSRIAQIIEAIPVIGEIIPADLAEIVEGFFEDMQNLYDAAYTVALRDEYRCDLFCIAVNNNCTIDFDDVLDYYLSKMGAVFPTSIDQFFGLYVTGQYTGVTLVAAWHVMVIYLMTTGVKILGLNEDRLVKMISALYNDPDGDWATLCDPCVNQWTSVLDFTTSDYGFVFSKDDLNNDIGVWTNGVGLEEACITRSGGTLRQLNGSIPIDSSTITSVRIEGVFTKASGQNGSAVALGSGMQNNGSAVPDLFWGTTYVDWTVAVVPFDNTQTSINGETSDEYYLTARPAADRCAGAVVIETVTITGTGTKPSQLP